MIGEPDVSLTDYGLAVECALFTYLLYRRPSGQGPLRAWFCLFFGATGVAAAAGGTVHGFFPDERTTGSRILWPLTLLAIGVVALAAWGIGARMHFSPPVARGISIAALLAFFLYAAVALLGTQAFAVAVLGYLPAALFLLVVFALRYRWTREPPVLAGLVGLVLTFVASGVQQAGVAVHPVYFNHNALYHLIEGVALFMIYCAARQLAGAGAEE